MVHIPDEDSNDVAAKPQQQMRKRPPTGEQSRVPTNQHRRPPTGEQSRIATGKQKRPATGRNPRQQTGKPKQNVRKRATQMMSLEPPAARRKAARVQRDARMDAMAGPKTVAERNASLYGTVGKEGKPVANPKDAKQREPAPKVKRPTGDQNYSLGGDNKQIMAGMMARAKGTRRVPKADGSIGSDTSPLDSGRRPPVEPQAKLPIEPPPEVDIPRAPEDAGRRRDSGPPSTSQRGGSLAGVSAEDLLGEEGRRVVEDLRRREAEASAHGDHDTRKIRQQGALYPAPPQPVPPQTGPSQALDPKPTDSARMAFQSAEYDASANLHAVPVSDELKPQGEFMKGPTRRIQKNVVQTPQAVDAPPPDDLGYERAVDFGDSRQQVEDGGGTGLDIRMSDEEDNEARESQAHEEMEQRAGYLLWLQGVITSEEIQDAITDADIRTEVQELLKNSGFTDQESLYRFLARHESLALIDLETVTPSDAALAMLRPSVARAYRVLPIEKVGRVLLVAASFPFDPRRLLELRSLTACKIKLFVAAEEEIDTAIKTYYPGGPVAKKVEPTEDDSEVSGTGEALEGEYDPTLSGEDSGLYGAVDGEGSNIADPPSDVGLAELDEAGRTADDYSDHGLVDSRDLDEDTLEGAKSSLGSDFSDNEITDNPEDDLELGDGGIVKPPIDTGPEDLDPFD